jgi:transcriptional regulator with XRE-family HTH domain
VGEHPVSSLRTVAYDAFLAILRDTRESQGISQRELSRRLGQQFTYIVKIERGTRRVDVVELVEICLALQVDPVHLVSQLRDAMVSSRTKE